MAMAAMGQETVAVVSKAVDRKSRLPGELLPYQTVDLRARVSGFVEKVTVDSKTDVLEREVFPINTASPGVISDGAAIVVERRAIRSE